MAVYNTSTNQLSNQGLYSPNLATNVLSGQALGATAYVPHLFQGLGNIGEMDKAYYELSKLAVANEKNGFVDVSVEDAIRVAGHIEPIQYGSPTAMSIMLLERCPVGKAADDRLGGCGLFYVIPQMFNRAKTLRTSFTGLGLLDHWAEVFPKFRPFVDAYAPDWVRDQITSDSFDLGIGQMPGWIKEKIAESSKLQERYDRKVQKEQAKKAEQQRQADLERMKAQAAWMQQQQMKSQLQKYYTDKTNAMTWSDVNDPGTWLVGNDTATTSGTAKPKKPSLFGSLFNKGV